jgi:hypothetical protein
VAANSPCPQSVLRERLSALVQDAEMDEAIEAGLIEFVPCATACCVDAGPLLAAQAQLRNAWAARERYRSRQARLQRRADERQARRNAAMAPASAPTAGSSPDSSPATSPRQARPALPASAAAILARAKAKAAGRPLE